ncbi:SpoIIE family protein phosphatase [Synechococcus sp. Nb3U1]|uniref:SpoIIE family protein phosphatase n=1 Tax=Synechococcus sp. Nb3U1 TaxID=1914529 RepID=UPI001F353F5C|nr:SpoIIE family protein phosphatase [Synechococcus sp. Nb3U1]MCF2970113.1 SpoIIE family protein phosphatase [Synechococcus sp. Nb3U1]
METSRDPTSTCSGIHLLLFAKSRPSVADLAEQLRQHMQGLAGQYPARLEVVLLEEQPYLAEHYKLVVTPALVKAKPLPAQVLVGGDLAMQLEVWWPRWQGQAALVSSQAGQAPTQDLQQQLEALKVAYQEQLPSKVDQLIYLWQQYREQSCDLTQFKDFYRAAHTLAGSSGMYGFDAISSAAQHLELLCKPWIEAADLPDLNTLEAIELGLRGLQEQPLQSSDRLEIGLSKPDPIYWVIQAEQDPLDLANTLAHQGYQVMICSSPAELQSLLPALAAPPSSNLEGLLPPSGEQAHPMANRVLVVDDDADINRLLCQWLRASGFQVQGVDSGEGALAYLQADPSADTPTFLPDLVFLDVLMPGISGLEVLRHIRQQQWDMAVIMTTAFGSEQVAIDALRQGADDYLRKPFDPQEFQTVLQRTIARIELRRQNAALRRQLQIELARAAEIQQELLPRTTPELPGFDLAARCLPAREVGGDFYDWQVPAPDLFNLVLGDVMGKGLPAALMMATVRAAIRALARQTSPLINIQYTAKALESDLIRSESFVTLFHAQLHIPQRRLTFVDGGHGHALMLRRTGQIEALHPRGMPLGSFFGDAYEQGEIYFHSGDALLLFSDGLLEARPDLSKDRSPLLKPFLDYASATELMEYTLHLALQEFADHQTDDLTVLVLRCQA